MYRGKMLSSHVVLLMLLLCLSYGRGLSIPVTPSPQPTDCEGLTNPGLNDPCQTCTCVDGQFECMVMCCAAPECVDSVKSPGACCPYCPNGPNCRIEGEIVSASSTVTVPGKGQCMCGPPGDGGPEQFCFN
ncbi:von Willebrand factor C domain-containing protein 2-like [Physella acuta]|uniref:von Willebrand factor C domain-containing protein 2-like n=1 Tax=Physella acuta TaxID=109671 RepID=UPI0027DCB14A|nr:von Willebrand factor C domain-containing protein 2-like [Physella acuta]